jgi:hypothetical protein
MSLRIRRPSPGTVLGAAALIISLTGVASAAIPDSEGTVTACYNLRTGALRVVDAEAGRSCLAFETQLLLASAGSGPACPDGTILHITVCFETTARAATFHSAASRTCAGVAGRLPSEGEMRSFRDQPGITVSDFEWTDELSDTDVESTFLYAVVGEFGSAVSEAFDDLPYRCVVGPS